jgi:hypothetical protein
VVRKPVDWTGLYAVLTAMFFSVFPAGDVAGPPTDTADVLYCFSDATRPVSNDAGRNTSREIFAASNLITTVY